MQLPLTRAMSPVMQLELTPLLQHAEQELTNCCNMQNRRDPIATTCKTGSDPLVATCKTGADPNVATCSGADAWTDMQGQQAHKVETVLSDLLGTRNVDGN